MVDRIDAGGGEVGVVGQVEGPVHEAAGEALGLGRVGLGQGAPARPARAATLAAGPARRA